MIARSVRPAIGATLRSSRPNSSRNTTPYKSTLTPPALISVWSTSQSTRRPRTLRRYQPGDAISRPDVGDED
jgi:hypothetical protein